MTKGQRPIGLLSFQVLLVILHCLVHTTVFCCGVAAIRQDDSVQDIRCNRTYHIFKYCIFNVALFFMALVTYFVANGIELIRSRAITLGIVHTALGVWGTLTIFHYLDEDCRSVFKDHYPAIWAQYTGCVCANTMYGVLYLFHEVIWPKCSSVDWSIVPIAAVPNLLGKPNLLGHVQSNQADASVPSPFPASIHQDLNEEYTSIMSHVPGYEHHHDLDKVAAPIGAFSTS